MIFFATYISVFILCKFKTSQIEKLSFIVKVTTKLLEIALAYQTLSCVWITSAFCVNIFREKLYISHEHGHRYEILDEMCFLIADPMWSQGTLRDHATCCCKGKHLAEQRTYLNFKEFCSLLKRQSYCVRKKTVYKFITFVSFC